MAKPLSPLKKKIHPWLGASFRKGLFAALLVGLFGMGWRAHHDENGTIGNPERRTAEVEQLDSDLSQLDSLTRDLRAVKGLHDGLRQVIIDSDRMKDRMNAPAITITYDRAWLEKTGAGLENDISALSKKFELQLIHSPDLSSRDFVRLSQKFITGPGRKELMWQLGDLYEKEPVLDPLPRLHECQKEIAAATPNEKTATAILDCAKSKTDWRKVTHYSAMAGVICLGFYGRRLRKKWDRAVAAEEQTVAGAAPSPAPYTGSVIVSTAQPVTVRTIKIKRSAGNPVLP